MRRLAKKLIIPVVGASILVVAVWMLVDVGYQLGKATPCVDEEQFEVHPMEVPQ